MEPIETREHRGYTLELHYDEDPANPRTDYDHVGTMVCFHGRYTLGDAHDYREDDYGSWEGLRAGIEEAEHVAVILPLGLYDHSGITMYVGSDAVLDAGGWDSGQVGWIYCTAGDVEENWPNAHDGKTPLVWAETCLRAEVEEYDRYLTGQVYGYVVLDPAGETVDSLWGIDDAAYAMREAELEADADADHVMRTSPAWWVRMAAS